MIATGLRLRDRHLVVYVLALALLGALLALLAVEALAALSSLLGLTVLHDVGVNTGPVAAIGGAAAGVGAGAGGGGPAPEPPPPPLPPWKGGPPVQGPSRWPEFQNRPEPTLWTRALDWLEVVGTTTPDPSNYAAARHFENAAARDEEELGKRGSDGVMRG